MGQGGREVGEQQELCMLCLHLSHTFCMNVDNANWQPVAVAGRLPASFSVRACVSFNIIGYLRAAFVCEPEIRAGFALVSAARALGLFFFEP